MVSTNCSVSVKLSFGCASHELIHSLPLSSIVHLLLLFLVYRKWNECLFEEMYVQLLLRPAFFLDLLPLITFFCFSFFFNFDLTGTRHTRKDDLKRIQLSFGAFVKISMRV